MSKESQEHLSCFMDGEINKETGRFLVRRLGADRKLRETWARYHLVRDCLRHQEGDLAGVDMCGKVQQAIAGEASQTMSQKVAVVLSKAVWLKPVGGVAIAASVALMAIMTVGPGQNPVDNLPGGLAESQQAESFVSPNNGLIRSPRSQQVSVLGGSGTTSKKTHSYLLRHYQVTGSTGGTGFVSFLPIVVTQAATRVDAQANLQSEPEEDEENPDRAKQSRQ